MMMIGPQHVNGMHLGPYSTDQSTTADDHDHHDGYMCPIPQFIVNRESF